MMNRNQYQDAYRQDVEASQPQPFYNHAGQEPFVRSEDAFRFGKLHQQADPRLYGGQKPPSFSFGIPDQTSPAAVAAHFPNSASHFPSSYLITAKVPSDREAFSRFDALHARRAAIAPYESARHEAATFRRNDILRRGIINQQRAELKRLEKIGEARDRKGHIETNNDFGIPTHVSMAVIASHFPCASSHFPMAGQSVVPIAFEQAHRFDGLRARREALMGREAERMNAAADRREALLVHRQALLEDKARMRDEGALRAKERRAQLYAGGMMANKQISEQPDAFKSNDNIPQSSQMPLNNNERELVSSDPKTFLMVFALPDSVIIADIERHFPNAAAAMHEFDKSDIKKNDEGKKKQLAKSIPLAEEEAIRFDLVPIRRAAIAQEDQKRQNDCVTRGLANVETRRFIAKNESLMRARRVFNKENAGWVNHIAVQTTAVKEVKERGTWGNVKKPNDPSLVVVDKEATSSHVADPKIAAAAAPVGTSVAIRDDNDAAIPAADHAPKEQTVIHATLDETGKPLVSEADIAAAASAHPSNMPPPVQAQNSSSDAAKIQETQPMVNSAAPASGWRDNTNNAVAEDGSSIQPAQHQAVPPQQPTASQPPVHQQSAAPIDSKVRPKRFCC